MPATTHRVKPAADPSSLFVHRPYLLFLGGRFFGTLATGSQSVVIAWDVYEIARRTMSLSEAAFAVGMIGLAQFLPLFALTLLAGETADRHDRRRIITLCYLAQVLVSTGLATRSAMGADWDRSSPWPRSSAAPGRSSSRRPARSAPCWSRSRCSRERSPPIRWPPNWPASSARRSAGCSASYLRCSATRSVPGSMPPPRRVHS